MGGANGKILGEEKQAAPAEYYHGNQDAENAGKDGQQHQFLVRLQDCEAVPNKFPGLSDASDGILLLDGSVLLSNKPIKQDNFAPRSMIGPRRQTQRWDNHARW